MEFNDIYKQILEFKEEPKPLTDKEVINLAKKTALAEYIENKDNDNAKKLIIEIKKETTSKE